MPGFTARCPRAPAVRREDEMVVHVDLVVHLALPLHHPRDQRALPTYSHPTTISLMARLLVLGVTSLIGSDLLRQLAYDP